MQALLKMGCIICKQNEIISLVFPNLKERRLVDPTIVINPMCKELPEKVCLPNYVLAVKTKY